MRWDYSGNIIPVLEHAGVKEVHAALSKIASIEAGGPGSDSASFESFIEVVSELKRLMNQTTNGCDTR